MAHFSFVFSEPGNAGHDELSGDYPDANHAVREAQRFLFDVGQEILTKVTAGQVRMQVLDADGATIFDATLDYQAHALEASNRDSRRA